MCFVRCVGMMFFLLFSAVGASGGVYLYRGDMDVQVTSGRACSGIKGRRPVTLVLNDDHSPLINGFIEGEGIAPGRFSGADPASLDLIYPYHDPGRAAGHRISIRRTGEALSGELRDRHSETTVDDCSFDLARLALGRVNDHDLALSLHQRMSDLFQARLLRSQALALSRNGDAEASLLNHEQALALADRHHPPGSTQLDPYLLGVANSQIRLGRLEEFNRLYDSRRASIRDQGARAVLDGHRARALTISGRAAMAREEYDRALDDLSKAYRLLPGSRDGVAGVVSAYVRARRYAEAITFLEQAEHDMERDSDRREVRELRALVIFRQAEQDDRTGRSRDAEAGLKQAMALDPGSIRYLLASARQRHKNGSYGEALRILDQGQVRFSDEQSIREIADAREKIKQIERMLKRLSRPGV